MPNIGGKKFPYTPAGRRAASSYARRTGQPMSNAGGYGGGNPGMRRPISRGGGYGMRGPGALAGLRSPRAPMRRNRMNPLAMLGMMRKRNIV
tara:strand:- start:1409 stop:1684 length:276 start_codon:yes stop_codon:yes gene_type:complete